MDSTPSLAPLRAPVELAPGVLSLDVCAGNELTFHFKVRVADLPCDPPGSRHSFGSLVSALEERVFRSVCHECGVHLCGPAPTMLFGPADPTEAFIAPRFGTGPFWRRVQLHGALRSCSFEWPAGLVHVAATPTVVTPSVPDRSAYVLEPSGSVDPSGWLLGCSPKTGSARTRAFFPSCLNPPIRQSGMLRVHVAARTLLRLEPETTISFDFDLNLFEDDDDGMASPQAFTRMMEVAVFARLCEEHGLQAPGPAPRGRFSPSIGCRVFFRAVAARGVGCHYRVCWPVGMYRRAPLPPLPSRCSSSSSSSTPSSPDCQPSSSSRLAQGPRA